ncbi:MAG: dienelactone hydrolase family protein [Anaerolineae bacterium]|nr:dienelactone hydrolase family protein [Anaerolineae bacterium]
MARTELVEYPYGAGGVPAFLASPTEAAGPRAVVLLQEWWGLNGHMKDLAVRFAAQGYHALVPDLYHGEIANEPDEARKLAMALDRDRAVAEICAAVEYLQGRAYPAEQVGVVGWCMGGGLALSTASDCQGVAAAVCFYGRPLSPTDTARISCPVLGLFAEHDQGIPVEAVRAFEAELARNQIVHEVHIYGEGAQHAFFNDTRPHIFHPVAAADAWQRTLAWLERYT